MSELEGIECPSCGASTPLPEDLTTTTFRCRYCHAELVTADFAGDAAVTADALLAHLDQVVATKTPAREATAKAPRFDDTNEETRPSSCIDCAAPISIPMDLHENFVTCVACGRVQAISKHVPQQERFELDMKRQVAGNEALARLVAEGAPCTSCGGTIRFPDDGTVQITCGFCGTTLLIGQYVDEGAVARRRLKHGVFAMREELEREQEESQANARFFAIVLLVIGVVIALIANFGSSD